MIRIRSRSENSNNDEDEERDREREKQSLGPGESKKGRTGRVGWTDDFKSLPGRLAQDALHQHRSRDQRLTEPVEDDYNSKLDHYGHRHHSHLHHEGWYWFRESWNHSSFYRSRSMVSMGSPIQTRDAHLNLHPSPAPSHIHRPHRHPLVHSIQSYSHSLDHSDVPQVQVP